MPLDATAASRLRAMFVALQGQGGGQPLRTGWANVLDVPEAEVQLSRFGLPLVARVLSRAVEEAERADTQVGVLLRHELIGEWREPVFTPGRNLDAQVQQHPVGPEALAYLDLIASVLQKRYGPQELPEGDELASLLAQVDDLAGSIEESTDLPEDVKQVLLRRLNQVRFAIEHVRIGGAEGVHEAVELFVGSAVVRHTAIPSWMSGRIAAFLVAFYMVFSAGPGIQASLDSWHDMGKPLIEAVQDVVGEHEEQAQPPDEDQASAADEH